MNVHLSDASYLNQLVEDLLRGGCVSRTLDEETLEVVHPDAETAEEARTELAFFLRAWQSGHPDVAVWIAS
jgi:hypothetical protein